MAPFLPSFLPSHLLPKLHGSFHLPSIPYDKPVSNLVASAPINPYRNMGSRPPQLRSNPGLVDILGVYSL